MIGQKVLKSEVVGEFANQDGLDQYHQMYQFCMDNNARIVEDGDYFVVEAIVIPEPTPEEIQLRLTQAVQRYLDAKAQELGYDSCLSVCSYVDTGIPKFDAEGNAFRSWRSAVWAFCYDLLNDFMEGKAVVPTEEGLIEQLPELVIEYPEPVQAEG